MFAHPELELVGLHCHLGSQITKPQAYELAAAELIGLMAAVRRRYGVALAELNLGGGHAVPYVAGDEPFGLANFASRIRRVVASECAAHRSRWPGGIARPGTYSRWTCRCRPPPGQEISWPCPAPAPTTTPWPLPSGERIGLAFTSEAAWPSASQALPRAA